MIVCQRFTLSNGLRVVHNYDSSTAMVAVNVLYNVGNRDEHPDTTGLAHLFEHLMFSGSANVSDYSAEAERAGGTENAWTSNDFTSFYDVAPAHNFETLLWLESDRMSALSFSEKALEVQRQVVIEEFKQTQLNRPYGDLSHRLRAMLYTVHPYRYPTIGKEIAHIENVTLDQVRDFFYSHYAPNNAVLSVCGNVPLEKVQTLVEKWFGGIPRRSIEPRMYQPEPPIESPREEMVVTSNAPQPMIVVAFPMCAYGEKGYIEADLMTDVLASGRSSRFYRRLVLGSELFTTATASIMGSEEPGYMSLRATLSSACDAAFAEARERLIGEVSALANEQTEGEGVTPFEVERAINRFASDFTFSSLSFLERAQALAMAEMHGENINDIVPAYRRVTVPDVAQTARDIVVPHRACTIMYRPK